jgi:hypothetical protein
VALPTVLEEVLMHFTRKIRLVIAAATLCAVCAPLSSQAQSNWLSADGNPPVSLEILKPDLYYEEATFLSTVWFLSGRAKVSDNASVLVELPVVFFKEEMIIGDVGYSKSETLIGNPYVGLRLDFPDKRLYGQIGGRVPVAPEDKPYAAVYGLRTDFDRAGAFVDDLLVIGGRVGGKAYDRSGSEVNLFAGPTLWIPVGDAKGDTEVLLDYGVQYWMESEVARVGAGITGRWITEDDGNLAERTIHQFGFAANFGSGSFRPGFHVRVPLDNDLGYWPFGVRYVYGITLSLVELGK